MSNSNHRSISHPVGFIDTWKFSPIYDQWAKLSDLNTHRSLENFSQSRITSPMVDREDANQVKKLSY